MGMLGIQTETNGVSGCKRFLYCSKIWYLISVNGGYLAFGTKKNYFFSCVFLYIYIVVLDVGSAAVHWS